MAEFPSASTVTRYRVPQDVLTRSVDALRTLSAGRIEAVVLWRGLIVSSAIASVTDLVVPAQTAGPLHFNVSLSERLRLIDVLAERGDLVLVQLHTHPENAFHSPVDDRLAIPQHEGAVSIVVPRFGMDWDGNLGTASVNRHLGGGRWLELGSTEVADLFEVAP